MADVVIVTPGQLGSNPRVVKEATALTTAGHRVHVVAVRVLPAIESRDREVLATAQWSAERVRFDSAGIRMRERLIQVASTGWYQLRPSGGGIAASFAHSGFARLIGKAALRRGADLYIAHYPAALAAAAMAARRHGAKFAFDAEDFHAGDLAELPANRRTNDLIRSLEGRYLRQAAYVSAASPGIAEAYERAYAIPRPAVVLNTFPRAEAPAVPTLAGIAAGPSLYWFSQTRGRDRGLECALEAIARAASRPHLHLRGTPQAGFDAAFLERARALGCADRVHLLPPEDPSKMVPLAALHDAGLVGETGATENRRIALTNKQFTYLLAGIPAILSDIPAHRDFAAEAAGAAFLYRSEDPASLASVLDFLFTDPARLAAARSTAWQLGQTRFNWEVEAPKLVEAVERVLPRGGVSR